MIDCRKVTSIAVLLLVNTLASCVADNDDNARRVRDLSDQEAVALCRDLAGLFPERTVHCTSSVINVGIRAETCRANDYWPSSKSCLTVGQASACARALNVSAQEFCEPGRVPLVECAEPKCE